MRPGILRRMSMSPTRLRECISLPGWSLRELARRLGMDDGSVRQMGSGKRPIHDAVGEWLERVEAAWLPLSEDLREAARGMGCDRGKFVRHPRGFRPLTDEEAVQLERLAAFHEATPAPDTRRPG
jgi:transcriptional regulator with XRE-family HTH domain